MLTILVALILVALMAAISRSEKGTVQVLLADRISCADGSGVSWHL